MLPPPPPALCACAVPAPLKCGHGVALVAILMPSFVSREDWKPVLTINSIIYGLQYLFLVSRVWGGGETKGWGTPE